jgi:hypothetical protein
MSLGTMALSNLQVKGLSLWDLELSHDLLLYTDGLSRCSAQSCGVHREPVPGATCAFMPDPVLQRCRMQILSLDGHSWYGCMLYVSR